MICPQLGLNLPKYGAASSPGRRKPSRVRLRRRTVCNLVGRSLVLFKVYVCLELPFFLLSSSVAYARFIQPEQNTRWVWSH